MKIGYIRVSSKEQNESRQIDALMNYGVELNNIYIDKQSGKDFERVGYKAMIKAVRKDDVIVVKSLDRFGRDYEEIRKQFQLIIDKGVHINVIDTPILNTDQNLEGGVAMKFIADLVLSVLGFVAEQERINIRSRQGEGILSAKKRGIKFGRPSKLKQEYVGVMRSIRRGDIGINEGCQLMGISRRSYYNYLKTEGELL